ncbi:GDYXXLXY domain-containing protein [Shewanella salipaludis]|uniref:GDYXXLXY domain-containing protein n=1 Tax=Shewanella salipaludis TaxID=2723052 RepID=A0A972G4G6_9GAMM|nr:GDYXXLXY domain-containing protein [Shewanella salipaludis]NMH64260.1 GDYXXLXY domain-containing protein [Shewanella salipaludis]
MIELAALSAAAAKRLSLWVCVSTLLVLASVNWGIYQKERLLAEGLDIRFELAPVDPRSLMQGDYMALNYAMAGEVAAQLAEGQTDGVLLVRLDADRVGQFDGLYLGQPLQPAQFKVQFRLRHGLIKLASNAFFFEEGQGSHFAVARFGEFKLKQNGELLLISLLDENFVKL